MRLAPAAGEFAAETLDAQKEKEIIIDDFVRSVRNRLTSQLVTTDRVALKEINCNSW